jgi:hypothetical protein
MALAKVAAQRNVNPNKGRAKSVQTTDPGSWPVEIPKWRFGPKGELGLGEIRRIDQLRIDQLEGFLLGQLH